MNYFTKEWYELCQKTSTHLLLEEAYEAGSFSEEYFQRLYAQKLKEWLDLQKEIISYSADRERAKGNYSHGESFNVEKETEKFCQALMHNQEHIREILPKEILEQIADIRVFALNRTSPQVKKAVAQFCENNCRLVRKTLKEYQEYYKEVSESLDTEIVEKMNFHDCKIITTIRDGQSLIMSLDNSGGFTHIKLIRFENYEIIKQESTLNNSWWLYHEIYKASDAYELHVLLYNENHKAEEFIISFERISFGV